MKSTRPRLYSCHCHRFWPMTVLCSMPLVSHPYSLDNVIPASPHLFWLLFCRHEGLERDYLLFQLDWRFLPNSASNSAAPSGFGWRPAYRNLLTPNGFRRRATACPRNRRSSFYKLGIAPAEPTFPCTWGVKHFSSISKQPISLALYQISIAPASLDKTTGCIPLFAQVQRN